MKWEKPRIVDFSDRNISLGEFCASNGNHQYENICSDFGGATPNECESGFAAGGNCATGTTAGHECLSSGLSVRYCTTGAVAKYGCVTLGT